MTGPFSILLFLIAGACFLPFLVHGRLWWRRREERQHLWYALLGLGSGAYVLGTALLYNALELETYRLVLRMQTLATPLFFISLISVLRGLGGGTSYSRFEKVLIGILLAEPVLRLADPWTFVYQNVRDIDHRHFFWGERFSVLVADGNLIGSSLLAILFLGIVVHLLLKSFQVWREGSSSSTGLFVSTAALLLCSGIIDTVITIQVLPFPWVTEPTMGVVVLILGMKLQNDLFETARIRHEMEVGRSMLATLVEHSTDLVVRMDPSEVWIWVSHSIHGFAGLPAGDAVGQRWSRFVVPDDIPMVEGMLRQIARGQSSARAAFRMRGERGREVWVDAIARGLREPDGRLLEIHCVARDIDEARRREMRLSTLEKEAREWGATLEARVQARTEDLQRTIRDLESFAAMASHDMRAPLRAMQGFAQALEEDYAALLPAEGMQWLARIRAGAARLGNLIDSLLTLARTGQMSVERRIVDLSQIAQGVAEQLSKQDPSRKVDFEIQPELSSLCDANLAHVVVQNLLENAWKYSRPRQEARIRFGKNENQWLVVEDNGVGFDSTQIDALFQSFHRLHRPEEFEGSGIGLATCRRILELHGGRIRAVSKGDEGAIFLFHFGDIE